MDISETLERLSALHQAGALSDTEYANAKARVLGAGAEIRPAAATFLHRLHRSRSDRWFGGVCGGLGEQMGVPGWVLRLAFVLAACLGGTGAVLYLLLWIFMPLTPAGAVGGPARA
jgi:phage shock protein PspC (stress-responsive transcriptional regulator)